MKKYRDHKNLLEKKERGQMEERRKEKRKKGVRKMKKNATKIDIS